MKPTVFDCHKFTFPKQLNKVYLLFSTASISFFWLLAVSEPSLAQVNSSNQESDFQLGLGGLIKVPQSPVPSNQSQPGLKVVPPPPGSIQLDKTNFNNTVSVAPLINSAFKLQQTPANNIKQLENALIGQQAPKKAPRTKPSATTPRKKRQATPLIAVGGDNDCKIGASCTQTAALPPLPGTQPTQEFTAAPTFNQLLNSQTAALPPLPGNQTAGTATPTFNQLLNQTAALPPLPGTQTAGTATPASTFNQILNQTPNPGYTAQTAPIDPTFNSQTLPPLVPSTTPRQEIPPSLIAPAPQTAPRPVTETTGNRSRPLLNSTALREPSAYFQGVYITQGSDTTARARVSGVYPLTPQALFGATLDLTSENSTLDDSRSQGLSINELYFATSLGGLPNLRVAIGQLDLTSYFDRNSFAKDGASQFFNPVFQTNPALSATGISSRTGLLVNWSLTDNIEAKAAVFSSANKLSDFSLDGFAGEIGVRYGNAIIRGTYATDRDAGVRDTFPESFGLARNSDRTLFGPQKNDREEAYGLNAEVFIPNIKLGVFGRYGKYENRDLGKGADTYVIGASFVDLFTQDDRLGLAYGRGLSNESLRRGSNSLDVLELFYDFRFLPNLRLGFTVQGRDNFEETVFGVRVKTEFDVTPRGIAR